MAVYTHGHHESVLRSHNNRTIANSAAYLEPLLRPESTLLDVGAGPGTITVDFASRVAHVTATEIGPAELALSQRLAAERGAANISFSVEDAHALGFADDTFDIVHAHQVLQHVGDPVQALREMRRVAKPGGIVAARDAGFEDVTATASTWCYATPDERAWWGGMWADRIVESALARQLVSSGMADESGLRRIAAAWRSWAAEGDGWYLVPHGEILCRA
ncbi:MAG: class I SAM-dependent methyltransferase [Microbacterium sp.]|uniref:class I SAM-dependent methyltransferase n=1 Tax=Microbacterium sp. TaxID=51671 RepID=UPI0039E34D77